MAETLTLKQTSGTTAVGCKLPHGLEIFLEKEADGPPDPVTGRRPKIWVKVGKSTLLMGTNAASKGGKVVGGFGLTNIPTEWWERWVETHQDFEPLAKGFIITGKTTADVKSLARENKGLQGIEPIDAEHPELHNGPDTPKNLKAQEYEGMPDKDD